MVNSTTTAELFEKTFFEIRNLIERTTYFVLFNYSYDVWKILENQFTYGFLHSNHKLATSVYCGDRHFSADINSSTAFKVHIF